MIDKKVEKIRLRSCQNKTKKWLKNWRKGGRKIHEKW